MSVSLDQTRLISTMNEQAQIGATEEGGLHRLALSDADKEVRDWFQRQMEKEGLVVRVDAFGNMFGRREGTDATLDPLLLGSHLDSQPNGGIYDGALGVIAALEFVRALNENGMEPSRPVEIVNWTNEEGSRFQPPMQGSGVWSGELSLDEEHSRTDTNGISVKDELARIGYLGSAACKPMSDYYAYLELHVEQGPYLQLNEKQVGVVTGIVGFVWGETTYFGNADHTGPTPMHSRKDPLVAAADVITQVRRLPSRLGGRTVGTVGSLTVEPNSINTIPATVEFTWGIRDPNDELVNKGKEAVIRESEWAGEREGVEWEWEQRHRSPSVRFPQKTVNVVEDAASTCNYDHMRLFSGAGHDAVNVAKVCDTAMVFAVSEDGISHSEQEYTSWNDCYAAANTFATAALSLAG